MGRLSICAEAVALGSRIGLMATFAPSLDPLPNEFRAARHGITVHTALAPGALALPQNRPLALS